MRARWLIVLVTAAALIVVPLLVAARPASTAAPAPIDLAGKISASASVGWSGQVSSSGGLQVPDSEGFANLAEVLGDSHALRVWWRDAENWRIDSVRSTGETDLFFNGHVLVRWVFEAQRATIAPTSIVRLPDARDLLPATLGDCCSRVRARRTWSVSRRVASPGSPPRGSACNRRPGRVASPGWTCGPRLPPACPSRWRCPRSVTAGPPSRRW